MPEIHLFEPSETKPPPSVVAYYHDQKGKYHDPKDMVVLDHARVMRVHEKDRDQEAASESTGEEMARFNTVFNVIKDDDRAKGLLADLVKSCGEYLDVVARFNVFTSQGEREGAEYRSARETLDRLRRVRHEALISNLKIFQRYLRLHYGEDGDIEPHTEQELPASGIYTESRTDRNSIGRWAIHLATDLAKALDPDIAAFRTRGEAA